MRVELTSEERQAVLELIDLFIERCHETADAAMMFADDPDEEEAKVKKMARVLCGIGKKLGAPDGKVAEWEYQVELLVHSESGVEGELS